MCIVGPPNEHPKSRFSSASLRKTIPCEVQRDLPLYQYGRSRWEFFLAKVRQTELCDLVKHSEVHPTMNPPALVLGAFLAGAVLAGGEIGQDRSWVQSMRKCRADTSQMKANSRCNSQALLRSFHHIRVLSLTSSLKEPNRHVEADLEECSEDTGTRASAKDRNHWDCCSAYPRRSCDAAYEQGFAELISEFSTIGNLCRKSHSVCLGSCHGKTASLHLRGGQGSGQASIDEQGHSDVNMNGYSMPAEQAKDLQDDFGGMSSISKQMKTVNPALGESLPEPLSSHNKGGADASAMDTDSERVRSKVDGERGAKDVRSETSISHTEETTTLLDSDGSRQQTDKQPKKYRHPTKNAKRDMIRDKFMQALKKHEQVCVADVAMSPCITL
jgi:hypothetical protein